MKKDEIIQNNKLIASYMNLSWTHHPTGIKIHFKQKIPVLAKYNSSWDWLMPIVEKINSDSNNVKIFNKGCQINAADVDVRDKDTLIECVYEAVVKFIKLQNK